MPQWYKAVLPSGQLHFFDTRAEVQRFINNNDVKFIVKSIVTEDGQLLKKWRYNDKYHPEATRRFHSEFLALHEAILAKLCARCKRPCNRYANERAARCAECQRVYK